MYSMILQYLKDYIFNDSFLTSNSFEMFNNTITLQEWLCHTTCIILAVVFFICILLFIRYLFRLFAGLLSFR